MQEEKELTRIERELVLQYLRDDNVPLTVTLEEKPEQAEASLVDSKTDVPGKEKRKSSPGKEGKLGVEGMSREIILLSLHLN